MARLPKGEKENRLREVSCSFTNSNNSIEQKLPLSVAHPATRLF